MSEEEFNKKVKSTKTFCLIFGIIFIVLLIVSIFIQSIPTIILSIISILAFFLFYYLTKKNNIAGPIIGIILGAAYILQLNIVTIIIGIFVIVDCSSLIIYISKYNKSNKTKE